jgi:signal transduction histidine kinase
MALPWFSGLFAGRPHRVDAVLAGAFCAVSLLQVLLDPIGSLPASVLVAIGSTLPLAWRRRRPVAAALAGSAIWLIPTGDGFLYLGYVVAVLLFFSVGTQVASLRVTVAVAATGAVTATVATLLGPEAPGAVFGSILAVAAPAAVGRLVGHQRAQAARLQDLTERLRRERAGAERAAVAEERSRIARELHDVVGHEVSVIALQADAAAAALETAPALARAPVAAIRESAGEALAEMRRVLGALREDEVGAGLRPQPGFADLPALADRARAAGTPVELAVGGAPRPAPPSVELAAYRLAQEALTNARKHAPGAPVRLEVAWEDGVVALRVADAGPGPPRDAGTGYGLVGMRERVRLLGGELHTGPAPGGGFEVAATLPVNAPEPG